MQDFFLSPWMLHGLYW